MNSQKVHKNERTNDLQSIGYIFSAEESIFAPGPLETEIPKISV